MAGQRQGQQQNQPRLAGLSALVTGGSRGIGLAIAHALTQAGCDVTVMGRQAASLEDAVRQGAAQQMIIADVTDLDALSPLLAGRHFDILVNNAGTAISAPFAKQDPAAFAAMTAQHLSAPAELARLLLPAMLAKGFGRIINIGSTASVQGYQGVAAYVAAKHAILGLTRALALEVAKKGVTVNAVCPGFTATDLILESMAEAARKTGQTPEEVLAKFVSKKPLGRLVEPKEVAFAVVMLADPQASAINGQGVIVDGGESIA
jgi:NAD(P)-dependent dehydrogenase (short-subunit alcohol dehydrogenase family)